VKKMENTIKEIKGYWIKPGKAPEKHRFLPSLANLNRDLDGQPEMLKVRLTSGKAIVIVDSMDSAMKGKDYNFTITVVPDNKKSWIDITGDALIFGRDDDDNFTDVELTDKEIKELISHPYD